MFQNTAPGGDINMRNLDGDAPLHTALRQGHLDTAKYLIIINGAKCDTRGTDGETPLYLASKEGYLDIVELLVKSEADVNRARTNGDTPLHAALCRGHLNAARFLLSNGAKCNMRKRDTTILLYLASGRGYLDIVKYLVVTSGADVNSALYNGGTPLHAASREGHLDIVRYLIRKGAQCDTGNKDGATPLYRASEKGFLDIVEQLMQSGADVNRARTNGDTPLHAALRRGHLDTAWYLLSNGAPCDTRGAKDETPLYLASGQGCRDIVELLVKLEADVNWARTNGDTPLHAALRRGHLDTARYLLNNGAPCDTRGADDETPLYLASGGGYLDIVEFLVKSQADVNRARTNGDTPLHAALRRGHLDTARYLLNNGAPCDTRGADGETPLYLASGGGYLLIVELLVKSEAGALYHGDTYHGDTPLHAALREGHLDIVIYLIRNGANCHTRNMDGRTPLYLASEKGHLDIVEELMQSGAYINKTGTNGETPLHGASRNGHLRIVKYLVEAGAKVNIQSQDGERPLEAALRRGHHDVVIYLSEHAEDKKKSTLTDQTSFQRSASLSIIDHETSMPRRAERLNCAFDLDIEDDQYYQSRSTDEPTTTEERDTINLEEYHIVAKIPAGEQCVNDITIQLIEKAPSDLILKEDEAIIAVGLKFSPLGLQFSTPLKITVPHSAIFTHPKKANIFLYTRANDGDTFSRVSPSADGTPRCIVRQDDLDLYIDHFSEWWIITYLRETFIGKRLMCTPYVPVLRPMNVTHCIIMVLKDDVRGTTESIPGYKAALPGTQFLVRWRYGKLGVAYRVDDKEMSHKAMEEREFYYLNNHRMYFRFEPVDPDILQVMVEFILSQYITKQIMFPLITQSAVALSPLPSQVPPVSCNPETIRRTYSDEVQTSIALHGDDIFDIHMMEEPNNEDRDLQDTVRTIRKDPGTRPKTRKDRGSSIQSHPASSSISSQISPVVHSSDCEPSSTSAKTLSDLQSSDAVPDDKLNTLATHIPNRKYTDLSNRLGISFTPAGNILTQHGHDSVKAIRECLAIWKVRTGGSKAELEEILCCAEIGALVEHIE